MRQSKMIRSIIIILIICKVSFAANYNINLMWINKKLDSDQEYFCSTTKTEDLYMKDCVNPIAYWLKKLPKNASLNVWYDSKMSDKKLIERIKKDLMFTPDGSLEAIEDTRLSFLDLRTLPDVENNSDIFSEKIPVYFRADLLRAIVGDYMAREFPEQYTVYADFNIPALDEENLFDKETTANLKNFGFVMAENRAFDFENRYENAFFILDPKNASLMKAHRAAVIDINIKRGKEYINRGLTKKERFMI